MCVVCVCSVWTVCCVVWCVWPMDQGLSKQRDREISDEKTHLRRTRRRERERKKEKMTEKEKERERKMIFLMIAEC